MFDFILGFSFFVFIIIFITVMILLVSKKRRKFLKNHPIPDKLGIYKKDVLPISQALEKSLPSSYQEQVKYRVLRDHPNWVEYEYEWTVFELKRYFVMNSLLKSVPMFSTRVDDIWHEMLMFTREYDTFSKDFYHEFFHHIPNLESTPFPGEKAFFDWVYLSLFESTPNSRAIWGNFLQHPIKREILDDFRKLSVEEVLTKYFRSNGNWIDISISLIEKMKKEIKQADNVMLGKKTLAVPPSSSEDHFFQYALGAAVFYSIYEDDQFQEHMHEWYPSLYYRGVASGGVSSCSGVACSSSSDNDSGGDSGGGSSCSSCGGGCSS